MTGIVRGACGAQRKDQLRGRKAYLAYKMQDTRSLFTRCKNHIRNLFASVLAIQIHSLTHHKKSKKKHTYSLQTRRYKSSKPKRAQHHVAITRRPFFNFLFCLMNGGVFFDMVLSSPSPPCFIYYIQLHTYIRFVPRVLLSETALWSYSNEKKRVSTLMWRSRRRIKKMYVHWIFFLHIMKRYQFAGYL